MLYMSYCLQNILYHIEINRLCVYWDAAKTQIPFSPISRNKLTFFNVLYNIQVIKLSSSTGNNELD
jgi:hypothetical protein